ncbi:hypothetical protein H310_01050 [Aphanomyces invadans]|uniref:Uncharacterized protein n=1 Tax=Aphanomyces invadans TaxID=157072 RepID=A0A024URJ8_9STRA|nr:hypothetical protein H310_01050 [Aphanomyces invadans]ETW08477.1 hypothetical protein H310_01050 [Aphanomyces invadans]|eukprot:XP_008862282.1 hypothetical protein H310_01050 [Aphanomyces invadans]
MSPRAQVFLSRLEEQDRDLTEIKVDEVLGFVRHIRPKVATDNTMPSWVVLLVEFFLDERRYVLLNVVLLQRLRRAVHCVLLHVFMHVCVLDHGLSLRHRSSSL